jgi:hypothetical protein
MVLELPLGAVRALAELPQVRYIEPAVSGAPPPQSGSDVAAGRALINSDRYFNMGPTAGRFGLLDTGVRSTHVQFTNPSNLGIRRDCRAPATGV